MNLRPRLALTTAAVAVPLVLGLVWLDARSRHRAAEQALAHLAQSRVERPDEQARCEGDPVRWGRPLGLGPGPGRHDGPAHRPPPPGPRAAPPEFFAYDATLASGDARAPGLAPARVAALAQQAWIAIDRATFDERVSVLVRTPWPDGPCAYVLVRGTSPRGFIGAILPASELWLAPLAAVLVAVLIVVGPVVRRVRRLTAEVRRSAAGGFVDAPTPTGTDEVRALGDAFVAASAEVRRQLAARDDRERALREFLANTTHDVMIPLTVLTQHLASLRAGVRTREPAELDQIVAQAMDEAHYLAALLHNLSVAARVDVAEPRLERSPIDLNALVARVIARHRPVAVERGIELDSGVPERPVIVDADLTMLEQAVSNVAYNAIRYNRRGGHVAVVLDRADDDFVLRVLDDGPGIPPPDLGSLIGRGFRSDAARTRTTGGHGGHGIGLHITHTVARLHDYRLTFRNREPTGLEVELAGAVATRSV
ncbi:MAG: HAMP domain-containing protein [Myxococcales bacterium]|nr:HAMP domain-containing protein [Myxococcales bacterium]